jgi:hypothetical protein
VDKVVKEIKERQDGTSTQKEGHEMMADERQGITSLPLFPSLTVDDFAPPMLHNQMGVDNAVTDSSVAWLDIKVQKVGSQEKVARLSHMVVSEAVVVTLASRDKVAKELSALAKQLKI